MRIMSNYTTPLKSETHKTLIRWSHTMVNGDGRLISNSITYYDDRVDAST